MFSILKRFKLTTGTDFIPVVQLLSSKIRIYLGGALAGESFRHLLDDVYVELIDSRPLLALERFFLTSTAATGGGPTELRIFNSVCSTTFFGGCFRPSILSSNSRAALVPS